MTTTIANTEPTIMSTRSESSSATTQTPKGMLWTGRVISGLIVAFMLFDSVGKLVKVQPVIEATTQLGYPETVIVPLGVTLLVSTILYAIPQTAVLGAILLTGYLGGATATHVRLGDPNYLFAVAFGSIAWLGLYLRDAGLRSMLPVRRRTA